MSGSSSSDSEMTAFWSTFPAEDRAAVDRLTKLTKASLDTVGEMIQFFEARASIAERKSQELADLNRQFHNFGAKEVGATRISLLVSYRETQKEAKYHRALAQRIRDEVVRPLRVFHGVQIGHRDTAQAAMQQLFKQKCARDEEVRQEQDGVLVSSGAVAVKIGEPLESQWDMIEEVARGVELAMAPRHMPIAAQQGREDAQRQWSTQWREYLCQCQDLEEQKVQLIKDQMTLFADITTQTHEEVIKGCTRIKEEMSEIDTPATIEEIAAHWGASSPDLDIENTPPASSRSAFTSVAGSTYTTVSASSSISRPPYFTHGRAHTF